MEYDQLVPYLSSKYKSFASQITLVLEFVGQGHGLELLQWYHSMKNIKIYNHRFLHFVFCQGKAVQTKVTDTRIERQTDIKMYKYKAIGEILQICL